MLLGDIIFIAARGRARASVLHGARSDLSLKRENVHRSLLKLRNAYRAYIKRGHCQAMLDRYNQMLGLHVTVAEFEHAKQRTACDEEEFFGYEFYRRTDEERDAYLTRVRRNNLARKVGDVAEALSIPCLLYTSTADFRLLAAHEGAFQNISEPIELIGFTGCGGCPGKRAPLRARLLVERGADAIAFASCIGKGTPIEMCIRDRCWCAPATCWAGAPCRSSPARKCCAPT